MKDLQFVKKGRKVTDSDVRIWLNKSGKNPDNSAIHSACVRFSSDALKKVSKAQGYLSYAIYNEERIYFKEVPAAEGFKISKKKKDENCSGFILLRIKDTEFWKSCVGDFDLLYDREEDLYYIDLEKPIR